jgi:hypothetical protein
MTCLYPFDDGAYVLGALSPTERAEYERHLSTCQSCRESVAALAVLPGLLSRLDPASVATQPVAAPPTLLPRMLALVAARRRAQRLRRRWLAIAACVAALLLASGVGVGVRMALPSPSQAPVLLTAMRPVMDNIQMEAKIGLTRDPHGTWISMQCQYDSRWGEQWNLQLVVYPRTTEGGEMLGRWSAESDQDWTMRVLTHYSIDQIGRVEMQRSDGVTLAIWMPS